MANHKEMTVESRWPWSVGKIALVPILHGRVECCAAVREAFERIRPEAVGVELPHTLTPHVLRGVERLPSVSAVQFQSNDERTAYLLLEPVEPLVEALRCGLERELDVSLVDRDTDLPPQDSTSWPDTYALRTLDLQSFVNPWLEASAGKEPSLDSKSSLEEHLREVTMAHRLQRLAERYDRVMGVVGLAHLQPLLDLLKEPQVEPIGRASRPNACLVHVHRDSTREVLSDPAFIVAAYERWRGCQPGAPTPPEATVDKSKGEMTGVGQILAFPGVEMASPDSLGVDEEPAPAKRKRPGNSALEPVFDRWTVIRELLAASREHYKREDGETLAPADLQHFLQYVRNLALVEGKLVPDLYPLVLAARGVGDDDFAYRLWEVATDYPWQENTPQLPEVRIRLEDLGRAAKQVEFSRRLERSRRIRRIVRERKKERYPGEWRDSLGTDAICSHQPEDIRIESYGRFLQQKAKSILSAEQTRVEPFSTSLLDGIDMRETLRHWHEKTVYVRESLQVKGNVGSVVVIFEPDDNPQRGRHGKYSWTMTWQGEHEQESDMALYATHPRENPAGPGIGRAEYGGFVMSYPPGRMFHVWEDPCFDLAHNKAERLLLAALDYSEERHVVYVSASPPRSWFHTYASKIKRKILYVPIGNLSPVTLKRIRTFHVLSGHHVRSYAKDYVW